MKKKTSVMRMTKIPLRKGVHVSLFSAGVSEAIGAVVPSGMLLRVDFGALGLIARNKNKKTEVAAMSWAMSKSEAKKLANKILKELG